MTSNPTPNTATAINFEAFERQSNERIMDARIRHFMEHWQPQDPELAHHFSADFMMLVRAIYQEAAEPAQKQLLAFTKALPLQSFILSQDKGGLK